MNAAEIIAEAIRHEESERDAAPTDEKYFWDGWDADAVRAGRPVVYVTVQCPGTGSRARFVAQMMVELPGAKGYVGAGPDAAHVETVGTRAAARRNGLEGHAQRLATRLYGSQWPVVFKHHV